MIGFLVGAAYPVRALRLLAATRALWPYVVVPIGLNVVVGATVYAGLLLAGFRVIDGVAGGLPPWAAPLAVVLRVLLVVGLLVATGFVLVRFGVVLGAPWYGRLSERVELLATGRVVGARRGAVADLTRAVAHEGKKLLLVVSCWLLFLLLNLVPVLGTAAAAAGGLALAGTVACLDFLDPALDRRGLGFRAELAYVRRAFPVSAGFGVACVVLTSLPVLNLLLVPICAAAGTLLVCDDVAVRGT
jgi:CysZ protein